MNDQEILLRRKEGKFVIKAKGSIKTVGNPFNLPFPNMQRKCTFAVLDQYELSDLPQLKKFAAERLNCPEKDIEIEVFEPIG